MLSCSGAAIAVAQDAPAGLRFNFDITQRLEYSDDNQSARDDGLFGRTILGFGIQSIGRVETFALDIGVDIEEGRSGQSNIEVTNPTLSLGYERDTGNALLGVDLRYSETDNDGTLSEEDFDQNGNIINQNDGVRESVGFTLRGAVGQNAPIGASFTWSLNELSFRDTNDPSLRDSTNSVFSGQFDFRIDQRITLSLTGGYTDLDVAPGGTDRESLSFGVAVNLLVSPVVTVDAGLSYDRIETSGATQDVDEGLSGNLSLRRETSNGDWTVSYSQNVSSGNDDERRSTLNINRSLDLPRGALSFGFGLTGTEVIGSDPLIQANYTHELPAARLSFGLTQQVVTDTDNNENINTSLNASYDQQINSLSSFGATLSLFNRNELAPAGNDGQRISLSINYNYDLTRDWGLVGGITHSVSTEDNGADSRTSTIFVGLQRNVVWTR